MFCCPSLLPTQGGLAAAITAVADQLSGLADVGVWVADGSPVQSKTVTQLTGPIERALKEFGSPNVLHDHGLWLPFHHSVAEVARARAIPRVVSTHGMLSKWALQHKPLRKRLAWWAYQRRLITSADAILVSSKSEATDIRRLGLSLPIAVIPHGVDVPDESTYEARPKDRIALFLGRLSPVKGLPMLIEAWRQLNPPGWRLVIAGPDEAGHKRTLVRLIETAGLTDAVQFVGQIGANRRYDLLRLADVLVLPSHSENFGLVVAEALAHGTPAMTTASTPWPGLVQRGCGWVVEPTVAGLVGGLRTVTSTTPEMLRSKGRVGRQWMQQDFAWSTVARRYFDLYCSVGAGCLLDAGCS